MAKMPAKLNASRESLSKGHFSLQQHRYRLIWTLYQCLYENTVWYLICEDLWKDSLWSSHPKNLQQQNMYIRSPDTLVNVLYIKWNRDYNIFLNSIIDWCGSVISLACIWILSSFILAQCVSLHCANTWFNQWSNRLPVSTIIMSV